MEHVQHLVRRQLSQTNIPLDECTVDTCPLIDSATGYAPSLGGNLIFVVLFGVLIFPQLFFGIRHKTWGFMAGMLGGLILEMVGYIGRVQLNDDPFGEDPFMLQIVTLTIGPAFLSAAIYLCLGRIVVIYGEHFSRLKPRTYSVLFVTCDFFALLLQAIGGAMASSSDSGSSLQDTGINIMIAGLSAQVVSLLVYITLCSDFAWRAYRNRDNWVPKHDSLRRTVLFKAFLWALAISTLAVFARSVFRVAELSEGFDSDLAKDEVTFMILEAAMIAVAVILMTLLHPGVAFQGSYHEADFRMRSRSGAKASGDMTPDEMTQP